MDAEEVQALKKGARTDVPKTAIRELDRKWEADEIAEESYRKERLRIEYQRQLRRLEREHKRLDIAKRELEASSGVPLQDHEIAHIWGIPAGSLAARKAKFLHQYLQGLQGKLQEVRLPAEQALTPPIDLWKETFVALSRRPVERTVAVYDGFEGTEATLVEKLMAFAAGTFPEDQESRFWLSLVQESRTNAEYGDRTKSLFPLQRLSAILTEMDTSPDALEQELMSRVSPKPKAPAGEPLKEKGAADLQLGEMGEHVLKSFLGEQHPDVHEDRFGRDVIGNFVAEYASGRTPIPCVRCNSFTKFRDLLSHADQYDKQVVVVVGKVTGLQVATNRQGQLAYGFLLNDAKGSVKVVGLGKAEVHDGEQVIVEGVFSRLRQVGRAVVYNEIKASSIRALDRLNPDLVG